MNDDQLIRTMRSMAGTPSAPGPATTGVIRRGRRRRALRRGGVLLGVVALCLGGYLGASSLLAHDEAPITPASPSPSPPREGDGPHAIVDPVRGTVTLPSDAWSLTPQEWATISSANDVYFARCLTAAGYGDQVRLVGPVPPRSQDGFLYGVWHRPSLEQYGYDDPHGPNEIPGYDTTNGYSATCYAETMTAGIMRYHAENYQLQQGSSYEIYPFTDEGRDLLTEWGQCLTDHGVTPPRDRGFWWLPPEAVGASLEEQIRIGEIDIACKEDLDFVQRAADIDVRLQEEWIVEAQAFLEAEFASDREMLAHAEAYLASLGLSMDDPSWSMEDMP